MRVYLDTRDWRVGYYRGTDHHYICPLPCVVIRIRRRRTSTARHPVVHGVSGPLSTDAMAPVTLEELVADAHVAIAETDWADAADAFSTQSYLGHLQASLPASHQLAMSEITDLSRPALAVAGADGSTWTVCVPGVGAASSADQAELATVAWNLIQQARAVESGQPASATPPDQEPRS